MDTASAAASTAAKPAADRPAAASCVVARRSAAMPAMPVLMFLMTTHIALRRREEAFAVLARGEVIGPALIDSRDGARRFDRLPAHRIDSRLYAGRRRTRRLRSAPGVIVRVIMPAVVVVRSTAHSTAHAAAAHHENKAYQQQDPDPVLCQPFHVSLLSV